MSATHQGRPKLLIEDCPAREILDRVGDKWSWSSSFSVRAFTAWRVAPAPWRASASDAHTHHARLANEITGQPYRLRPPCRPWWTTS
jgi:hypothetical protein